MTFTFSHINAIKTDVDVLKLFILDLNMLHNYHYFDVYSSQQMEKYKTTCVSLEFASNLVKQPASLLVTVAGRLQVIPLRVLFFRIQSARTQNNITSVCVCVHLLHS